MPDTPHHGLSHRDLRSVLGRFATGVTVVTTGTANGPLAMTANSFTSVSLDPPLVLWCPATKSARSPHFVDASHFAIHVLADHQLGIARHFAKSGDDFSCGPFSTGPHDLPLLDDCAARLICERHAVYPGGDHHIVLGQILDAVSGDHRPLLFCDGQFT